ncbi:MAG: PAS domain-containing protein [Candidatus Dormibacteria bacterium]
MQALADPAFLTTSDGTVVTWNRPAARLLGYAETTAVGTHCAALLEGVGRDGAPVCTHPCRMLRSLFDTRRAVTRAPSTGPHPSVFARHATGDRINLSVLALPVRLGSMPALLHLLRNEPAAERDPLTGSLSRDAFAVRAIDEQYRSQRTGPHAGSARASSGCSRRSSSRSSRRGGRAHRSGGWSAPRPPG